MKHAALAIAGTLVAVAARVRGFVITRVPVILVSTVGLLVLSTVPASADVDTQIPPKYGLCKVALAAFDGPLGEARGFQSLWPVGLVILLVALVAGAIVGKIRQRLMPNILWALAIGVIGAPVVMAIVNNQGGTLCA